MKVLLVKPHFKEIYGSLRSVATEYPPLGLMYIASYIENYGHDVKIIDMSAENMTEDGYVQTIEHFQPDVVGFTVTTPTSSYAHKLASITKNYLRKVHTIFGGPHPTAMPEEELRDNNLDFVVRGEGEVTMATLLAKNCKDVDETRGISYKRDGKILHNPGQPYIDNLDSLPFPAYHLIDISKYFFVDARKYPLAPLLTSRGCPYGCIYCTKNIFGRSFRARSAKNVVNEIEFLVKEYGVREIHIIDDSMSVLPKRVIEICNEIKKRKINVFLDCANGIRVDTVTLELFASMKDAGFYKVAFGIESGDQNILNNIKKGISLEQVKRAVNIAKNIGLEVWGFFMVGLPGENKQTIEKTVNFAIQLDLDVAKFYVTTPMPGTELFELWSTKGYIKSYDWSNYSFYKKPVYDLPNLSAEDILGFHRYCFKKFYFRPRYILKRMKRVSSAKSLVYTFKAGLGILNQVRRKR